MSVHNLLPVPASLRAVAQSAAVNGEPLVLMTTLAGCPFCDLVRGGYLGPMRSRGEVHAFQLDILDRASNLQDFNGQMTSPAAQATLWKARFAPTVLFLGPDGRELAERLVGVAVPDFYGEYLDERLRLARAALRQYPAKAHAMTIQK